MKTHLDHKFPSDLILRMREVCFLLAVSVARGRTKILTDSARKRSRKEGLANYNKTRINLSHEHGS
jgi:hypothetical protein